MKKESNERAYLAPLFTAGSSSPTDPTKPMVMRAPNKEKVMSLRFMIPFFRAKACNTVGILSLKSV